MENTTEMLKGVLEGCVLQIIDRDNTYGYAITQKLRDLGFDEVVEGTVYTILVRLEVNKLVSTVKKPSDIGPPRKFYTLTNAGRDELKNFWSKWKFISSKINELGLRETSHRSGVSSTSSKPILSGEGEPVGSSTTEKLVMDGGSTAEDVRILGKSSKKEK